MLGEIHALFYRYKTSGGFEYVSDLLIGPRRPGAAQRPSVAPFATHPGDSGTLWLLDPVQKSASMLEEGDDEKPPNTCRWRMQWGRNMLHSAGAARPQSYRAGDVPVARLRAARRRSRAGRGTSTSRTPGDPSVISRSRRGLQVALVDALPQAGQADEQQRAIISHDDGTTIEDSDFMGMGSGGFRPDGRRARTSSGSRASPSRASAAAAKGPIISPTWISRTRTGKTLLDLCKDEANIDPDKWRWLL